MRLVDPVHEYEGEQGWLASDHGRHDRDGDGHESTQPKRPGYNFVHVIDISFRYRNPFKNSRLLFRRDHDGLVLTQTFRFGELFEASQRGHRLLDFLVTDEGICPVAVPEEMFIATLNCLQVGLYLLKAESDKISFKTIIAGFECIVMLLFSDVRILVGVLHR